jgi:hypothetical protein
MKTNEEIIQQSLEEAQWLLDETMGEAALLFLGCTLNLTQGELEKIALPDLLLRALKELPTQGPIKGRDNVRILKAVTALLHEVPADDPRRQTIIAQASDVLERFRRRDRRHI